MTDDLDIKSIIFQLNERNKELNCLYKAEEILRDYTHNLTNIFYRLIEIIPEGMQFPEICKVKIIFNENEYASPDFKRTELKLSVPVITEGNKIGEIQVFYIKPVRLERKRIFLPEEYKMLSTIADKLGNYILYNKLRENISASENNETLVIDEKSDIRNWLLKSYLQPTEIEKILKTEIKFRKGETIIKQGAFATYTVILYEGISKSYIEGIQDSSYIFNINKPFKFIGLSSLFGKNNYHFSVTALTPCSVYAIDNELLKQITSQNYDFNAFLMKWYCNLYELLYKRIDSLANKQTVGRVASALITLSEEVFENKFIPGIITRKDIAEMAGMSTEGAVRILSEFKNDSIVQVLKEGIEVLKPELLKNISLA